MHNKLLLLFILLLTSGISAQEKYAPPVIAPYEPDGYDVPQGYLNADSILRLKPVTNHTVYPKKINPDFRTRYKGSEFDYTTVKPKESLWQKIEKRLKKILQYIFGENLQQKSSDIFIIIFRVMAIIIVGLVLYFLVSYLISKDGSFIFGKKNKKINLNDSDLSENIHEIDFISSIANYEKQKDYRSAVRYQYLYILKKLTDHKLIEWNPEKTNKDYVAEYSDVATKEDFRQLSYIFDYVWYGEFDINAESYHQFKNKFEHFKI